MVVFMKHKDNFPLLSFRKKVKKSPKFPCKICEKIFDLDHIFRVFSEQLHENVWVCKKHINKLN